MWVIYTQVIMIKDYRKLLESNELKEAIIAGEVCLFLGAGVAVNLRMPNWLTLARYITDFCVKNNVFKQSVKITLDKYDDPLKIISYCCEEIKKCKKENELEKKLDRIFSDKPNDYYKDKKNPIYSDLIEICDKRKALIVQTNYDNVIETRVSNKILPVISYEQKITDISNDMLVYLHGKCVNGDYQNWVFNRKKYNEVYVLENEYRYECQKSFFRSLLSKYHIIILGYSLQDVEILQWIANKTKNLEKRKKISVIIDNCEAKKFFNDIDASYWKECCENQIDVYSYSIDDNGFTEFEKVMRDLKNTLCAEMNSDITDFTDPKMVIGV